MIKLVKQNFSDNKKLYKKIEKDLRKDLDEKIPIDHVGSTVIPNMYGKNIIDILIGAKDGIEFENIKTLLMKQNFIASDKSKNNIYQFFSSTKKETKSGDIHIHLVIKNTQKYSDFIMLRDYLLKNKEEAQKYSDFKRELVKESIIDRNEYKSIKSKYVSSLIERVKK